MADSSAATCFGITNATVSVSSQMLNCLNITTLDTYNSAYCLSPPDDSCDFGYCPNPDIASPAVRVATYVSSICLSTLILYSPEDILSSFYSQLLSIYSFLIAAIIAIASQQLTRLHAVFVLAAAGSPLSLYLVIGAVRAVLVDLIKRAKDRESKSDVRRKKPRRRCFPLSWFWRKSDGGRYDKMEAGQSNIGTSESALPMDTQVVDADNELSLERTFANIEMRPPARLQAVYGPRQNFNRFAVLAALPIWLLLLAFLSLPPSIHIFTFLGTPRLSTFTQAACDSKFDYHLVSRFFYGPFILLRGADLRDMLAILSPAVALAIAWGISIYFQRRTIWKYHDRILPLRRIWEKVTRHYPFIEFLTVVFFPSFVWVVTLERGASFTHEYFSPTYGQLLAIFVAVPPVIQCILLIPRFWEWVKGLWWLRWIFRGLKKHIGRRGSDASDGSYESEKTRRAETVQFSHSTSSMVDLIGGSGSISIEPLMWNPEVSRSRQSVASSSTEWSSKLSTTKTSMGSYHVSEKNSQKSHLEPLCESPSEQQSFSHHDRVLAISGLITDPYSPSHSEHGSSESPNSDAIMTPEPDLPSQSPETSYQSSSPMIRRHHVVDNGNV